MLRSRGGKETIRSRKGGAPMSLGGRTSRVGAAWEAGLQLNFGEKKLLRRGYIVEGHKPKNQIDDRTLKICHS